jgi:hypothetical protein
MPTRTGRLTYTETATGIAATLHVPVTVPPPPPYLTEEYPFVVPAWAQAFVRANGTKTVTVSTDDAGTMTGGAVR